MGHGTRLHNYLALSLHAIDPSEWEWYTSVTLFSLNLLPIRVIRILG